MIHYHLLHAAENTRLVDIGHVDEDIISRVTVERSLQPLLIEMVSNETDAATQNEETIEGADFDVLISLLRSEGTTVTE